MFVYNNNTNKKRKKEISPFHVIVGSDGHQRFARRVRRVRAIQRVQKSVRDKSKHFFVNFMSTFVAKNEREQLFALSCSFAKGG